MGQSRTTGALVIVGMLLGSNFLVSSSAQEKSSPEYTLRETIPIQFNRKFKVFYVGDLDMDGELDVAYEDRFR